MSFKASLIKTAIKCTPDNMIKWVANSKLKGIAELSEFRFDLDNRRVFVEMTLYGETEIIEVKVDGFAIVSDGSAYRFIIQQGQSNRPWLQNLMNLIAGREWKIPVIPQFQPYIALLADLFKPETTEPEVDANVIEPELDGPQVLDEPQENA